MKSLFVACALSACLMLSSPAWADAAANKKTAETTFLALLGQQKTTEDALRANFLPSFVAHAGQIKMDLNRDLALAAGWKQAFPDLTVTIVNSIAETDKVALHWQATGTNTGAAPAMGLPATGKPATISGILIFRFENGKIAEEWSAADSLALLRQLGLLPAPAPRG